MSLKKQLVRFDFWLNPVFDQIIESDPTIQMHVCDFAAPDQDNWALMSQAHAYHICAARDEVPAQWQVDDTFLQRAPNLLCVSSSGAGFDPVDVQACNRHGVLVVNQSGCNADSVAEHTLGLLLAVRHRIAESDRVMRAAAYTTREDLMGHEIRGLTMGLIGVGNIGRRVARLAQAFGMRVLGHDPYLSTEELERRGVEPVSLEELVAQSDVVSVHCPRTPQTLNLFDAARFSAMREGAVFISTARGGIHDEAALAQALSSGHLLGAGLDVWTVEPPAQDNPLLTMANVVATYHTAGVTHEARRNAARMGAEQLLQVLNGQHPERLVNPEQWPTFEKRYRQFFG
jgi:D-3-phosphoglycerate dehydrogenase / 2-oxoglutarate reductase